MYKLDLQLEADNSAVTVEAVEQMDLCFVLRRESLQRCIPLDEIYILDNQEKPFW